MLLCSTDYDSDSEQEYIAMAQQNKVDGIIGFDGIRFFGDEEYLCSTIVQPIPDIAKMCVRLLLDGDWQEKPSLVCLPVSYACARTTIENLPVDE